MARRPAKKAAAKKAAPETGLAPLPAIMRQHTEAHRVAPAPTGWDQLADHELETRLRQHLEAMDPRGLRHLIGTATPTHGAELIVGARAEPWARAAVTRILGDYR